MNRSKAVVASLMLLVPALFGIETSFAETDQNLEAKLEQEMQRFELFTNCKPVVLIVEDLPKDAQKIQLTTHDIRIAVESRLRAARIYGFENMGPMLGVRVNIVGQAFDIVTALNKYVYDGISQSYGYATTWSSGMTGTHGRSGGEYVLSSVSRIMDEFLTQYLRANEKACEQK